MLNPPLSEEYLSGAMVGHFPPEMQNDMICNNLKTTQDALAYLSNMQALEVTREQIRISRREYDERDTITRPPRVRENDTENSESRKIPRLGTWDSSKVRGTIPAWDAVHRDKSGEIEVLAPGGITGGKGAIPVIRAP
jgi:hypothetical protein